MSRGRLVAGGMKANVEPLETEKRWWDDFHGTCNWE